MVEMRPHDKRLEFTAAT